MGLDFEFKDEAFGEVVADAKPHIKAAIQGFSITVDLPFKAAPYQIDDLRFLQGKEISANWSEMGTRKTSTALWMIHQERAQHTLIITTKTGKIPYYQCIPSCLSGYDVYTIESKKFIPPEPGRKTIHLAHYNLFTNRSAVADLILAQEWDLVILDEAHKIKSVKTQARKHIARLKAKRRHVMTGTGFVNRPDEVWSLLNWLEPKKWTSYWAFRNRYCQHYENDVWDANAGRYRTYRVIAGIKKHRVKEFREKLAEYGPRHTKKEVYPDLPPVIKTKLTVELNAIQRQMYESIKSDLRAEDQNGTFLLSPTTISALTRMRQIAVATPEVTKDYFDPLLLRRIFQVRLTEPSAKLDAMMDILEGLEWDEERKDQVVVFTQFRDAVELAKVRMAKAGISFIHMQQPDNEATRLAKVQAFQDGEAQVFICTLALGSESITLTAASTVIFLDRSWSPTINSQAISRVYGRGEERDEPVQIIQIEAIKTVDQKIESVLNHKEQMFKAIFD